MGTSDFYKLYLVYKASFQTKCSLNQDPGARPPLPWRIAIWGGGCGTRSGLKEAGVVLGCCVSGRCHNSQSTGMVGLQRSVFHMGSWGLTVNTHHYVSYTVFKRNRYIGSHPKYRLLIPV